MKKLVKEELMSMLLKKDTVNHNKGLFDLRMIEIENEDLSGVNFSFSNLKSSVFRNVNLRSCNFTSSDLENTLFFNTPLDNSIFKDCYMHGTTLRNNSLRGIDISGADLYFATMENTDITDIVYDDKTKWFKMHCPETGAFIGYKKCVNDRLVQLLIPADAKRTSATLNSCRCSKAKVLSIKSFDSMENFDEAWSLVDENFVYRVHEWVEVKNFNNDRFMDSTTGIHFWMTREEAIAY
ncbi:MAG: pentapeptide repeat-containing protein [Suipraeoptans sp.]